MLRLSVWPNALQMAGVIQQQDPVSASQSHEHVDGSVVLADLPEGITDQSQGRADQRAVDHHVGDQSHRFSLMGAAYSVQCGPCSNLDPPQALTLGKLGRQGGLNPGVKGFGVLGPGFLRSEPRPRALVHVLNALQCRHLQTTD